MKIKSDLEFCFKGSRKYVQGPDIFDAVVEQLRSKFNDIKNVKYSAYEMLHHNASLYITDKFVKNEYPIINSLITFISDGIKYYAVVCKNSNNIDCSVEYSEKTVQDNSKIEGTTIIFENTIHGSFTEITVSMNKHFLNQTSSCSGKWIVTKFDYEDINDIMVIRNRQIKIELVQNLHNKLTKSILYIENQKVGHLYFTLIEKES